METAMAVTREPTEGQQIHLMIVYEDLPTGDAAFQLGDVMRYLEEGDNVSASYWEICQLTHPSLLHKAVYDAVQADVIVVSVDPAKELPLDLYVWVDAWLPRRLRRPGVLVALLSGSGHSLPQPSHAQAYLEAVAHRGQLTFQLEHCDPYRNDQLSPNGRAPDPLPSGRGPAPKLHKSGPLSLRTCREHRLSETPQAADQWRPWA